MPEFRKFFLPLSIKTIGTSFMYVAAVASGGIAGNIYLNASGVRDKLFALEIGAIATAFYGLGEITNYLTNKDYDAIVEKQENSESTSE